jgi:hypothetical protein
MKSACSRLTSACDRYRDKALWAVSQNKHLRGRDDTMEGSALANAIRPGDGDIVEGPTTTAPVVSLRSDEAAAQVTQSGAPEGETGLVDVLDEASSLVWPELFDHGEGEVPPPEPPENAGSRIAVIPTSAPVASPRFDENQSDTGRAEHPQAWSADDTAVPPIESARSDEAGAQILRFETPHEAEAEEPEIRRSSLAMPSTTTVGPPSSEPDGSAIAEPERPEAQGNNIVAALSRQLSTIREGARSNQVSCCDGILPLRRSFGSEAPHRGPGDEVALKIECVVDGGMDAEEALGGSS